MYIYIYIYVCIYIYIYIYIYIIYILNIYIIECKNWEYVEQVQGVKWYLSWEAGFIFIATWEDLCVLC